MKFKPNNSILLTITFLASSLANSAELQLTDAPIFLNQSVPPALAVTFDDSGSMAWAYMPDSRSFNSNRRSFASPDFNLIYYNPEIKYKPPVKSDGTSMVQSNFTSAEGDGYDTSSFSRVDLSRNYNPFRYYYYYGPGSKSVSYAQSGRGSWTNRAFYYKWTGPADASESDRRNQDWNYTRVDIGVGEGAGQEQNFANWYTYYNTRNKLAKAAVASAFVNFGPDFKVDWQQINRNRFNPTNLNMKTFEGNHRNNFYDWLFKIPTNGGTPLRRATNDAGELFEDRNVYYDANFGDELSCQQNFHIAISDGSWNGSNSSVGISGNKDNSTTTLPDTNVYTPGSLMYSDNNSTSLADVAFYYWSRDLRSSLDNNVPTYIEDYTDKDGNIVTIGVNETWLDKPSLYWNPKNDPASWQHMVNFNVGLGIEGSFNRETDLPRLRSGALNWPDINGDTCYKYQPVFVNGSPVSVNEVETSCQRHVCYDTFDDSGNEIDCALYQDPWGPVKYCENLSDGGRSINCDNRIVRYVLESQGRVDDVWHSSINSRGDYFSARNPAELADALYNVVSNIITRKGRSSAGSVSSNIITDGTLSFKTGYDTSNWSGFVIAQQIEQDGSPGEVKWDAACKLTGGFCTATGESETATNDFESRNIYAFDKSSSGTGGTQREFDDSLPTAMKDKILNSNYYNEVLTNNPSDIFTADDVIDYIRGDKSTENSQGGIFRNRQNLLGDVIHSTAKVVRGPSSGYKDSDWEAGTPEYVAANADPKNGYKEYRTRLKNRTSILLVGANDGMLHAFDSGINGGNNGGHEYWAFIPSKSLDGISELANPLYSHKTYVDLSPTVKDAFIDGNWGTYAVGGLRKGGKEFYGLKLNDDPSQAPEILWEFTDKDDGDLGYTYNEARITRVINKTTGDVKWVALVPNGYNSSNHQSVLFALDLKTGSKLFTWKTGVGNLSTPNGMGPPVDADFVNRSGLYMSDQATDYAYAGDLAGNVYRFDMQDIFSGVSSSAPKKIYSGTYDRAITTSPRVFTPGNGIDQNVIVVFGTGKYIELTDRATTGVADQYIIGIKDSNGNTISPFTSLNDSRLVSQNLTAVGDNVSRILTSYPVGSTQGWKIKLIKAGERMVNEIGRNNQLKLAAIATIIPNGQDPCKAGGESWIMVIDARSGGKPIIGNFFNNGASTGIYVDDLILGFTALTTVGGNQQQYQIDVVGSGDSSGTVTIDVTSNKWRRRSWHRILID